MKNCMKALNSAIILEETSVYTCSGTATVRIQNEASTVVDYLSTQLDQAHANS